MVWKMIQKLGLIETEARLRIEDLLHSPRVGPVDVPVLYRLDQLDELACKSLTVIAGFDPAALLKVLREHTLVKI